MIFLILFLRAAQQITSTTVQFLGRAVISVGSSLRERLAYAAGFDRDIKNLTLHPLSHVGDSGLQMGHPLQLTTRHYMDKKNSEKNLSVIFALVYSRSDNGAGCAVSHGERAISIRSHPAKQQLSKIKFGSTIFVSN